MNLTPASIIQKRKRSDNGLVNPSKKLKQENTILNKDDNQTKCDDDDDQAYGRLVYNSDFVHSDKEVKIMRVTLEIPETYTKSGKEHIFNMLKIMELKISLV